MMIIKYELRIPLDPGPYFSRTAQHSTLNGGNPGALKTGYGILTGTECLTMVQMKKYAEMCDCGLYLKTLMHVRNFNGSEAKF